MQNKQYKNKRDLILVSVLVILVGAIYISFKLFMFTGEASQAHVYYGTSTDPIVTIDFVNYRVIRNYTQNVPDGYNQNYPIIDEEAQTITLLGDYELNGIRQIVVIKYEFGTANSKPSVEIIQEQSPNNICSREGVSTGKPLICLPNRIRVEFDSSEVDFTV